MAVTLAVVQLKSPVAAVPSEDNKTRLSAGSGLMLDETSDARRFCRKQVASA